MWLPSALPVVVLVGYPLLIAPPRAVLTIGVAAIVLCALGVAVRSTPVVVVGGVLALGEYALALWLSTGPPRLTRAVLFGVGLLLLLETTDFARRLRHAAMGPGGVASHARYWVGLPTLPAAGAGGLIG